MVVVEGGGSCKVLNVCRRGGVTKIEKVRTRGFPNFGHFVSEPIGKLTPPQIFPLFVSRILKSV